ncbi:MAG: acyloxyacyl hydrolase [Syntrophales bacterium]|jgi:hypothetical protein|nr:acyloxyacyl hydrolase [Syntrophales bacterium]
MNIRHRFLSVLSIIALFVFFGGMTATAEENSVSPPVKNRLFAESALITGFGSGTINEGHYQTVLLIWHLGINMDRVFPSLKSHKGNLTFYIEPQINPVVEPESDFEFGIGLGFQYRYPVTEKLSAYLLGSVGPHYISVVTDKQENGFIFSEMVGGGIYYNLNKRSAINVGYRFRHMSNADIDKPNAGIESHFGVIGYSVFFD